MMEIVISKLSGLLETLASLSKEQREFRDNALRSISHALTETCIYYQRLERGGHRKAEIEEQLSRYWAAAAIPVKHLDPELALICDKKSDFWINQENWPPERIERNKIGLDRVRSQYRQMLVPKYRRNEDTHDL